MFGIPLLLAQTALSIGGKILEHKAEKKAYNANVVAANNASAAAQNALTARADEEQIAAGQQIDEATQQAVSASALARLSAIQAGVSGQSVDAILRSIPADLGRYNSSVKQNLDLSLFQVERQRAGVEADRVGRINSRPRPNPYLTGLSIASDVVDLGTKLHIRKNP